MNIGLIGTGNMGSAILQGYIAAHPNRANQCFIYDVSDEAAKALQERTGAVIVQSVEEVVRRSDATILAVKPFHYDDVLPKISTVDLSGKTLISIAAGITIPRLAQALGEQVAIVRIMPNTPASVGCGMTAVWRNEHVTQEVFEEVMELLASFGKAMEFDDEEQIHAVIGAGGSSPAYAYMFIDAIAKASAEEGMSYEDALLFSAQAVMGAAKMVLESGQDPVSLRIAVCSPKGTTIEAVETLQKNGFEECVAEAVRAAAKRSREMSAE